MGSSYTTTLPVAIKFFVKAEDWTKVVVLVDQSYYKCVSAVSRSGLFDDIDVAFTPVRCNTKSRFNSNFLYP